MIQIQGPGLQGVATPVSYVANRWTETRIVRVFTTQARRTLNGSLRESGTVLDPGGLKRTVREPVDYRDRHSPALKSGSRERQVSP